MTKKNITIFMDRDNIINRGSEDYIKTWDEFVFKPHIFRVLRFFKNRRYRVLVVTNQSGVNRGLIKLENLVEIHRKMRETVFENGGQIDWVYFCPHTKEENCDCKKPKSGMFLQAKMNFPDIDFERSFMIGDWYSDMDAASALGIKTCFLIDKFTDLHKCKREPDFCISDISQATHLVHSYFSNKKILEVCGEDIRKE